MAFTDSVNVNDIVYYHKEIMRVVIVNHKGKVVVERVRDSRRFTLEKFEIDVCLCPNDGHSELCPVHKTKSSPR